MLYNPQCGKCKFCKNPKTNLCRQLPCLFGNSMPDGTSRFACKGQKVSHFMGVSSFSEYTVVPEWGLCKISNKIPLNRACLLGCSVPSGYGSAIKTAKVEKGSTCAIWGLGGVGLACALGCKDCGASKIIGIDINPDKFETAKKFGATECLNPKDYDKPIQEILKEKTDGDGFDYTFECVGTIETMKAALESTINGYGMTIIVGATPAGHTIDIPPVHFLLGHTCKGNIFGDMEAKKDLPKLVDKYLEKKLPLDDLVSHEFPFEKINSLLEAAHKADCLSEMKNSTCETKPKEFNENPKVIECRAAVAWESAKPLSIEKIQVAPPKAHEIRVKVITAGVCHTDATSLNGVGMNVVYPAILGHEGAGIVESFGEGVTEFKPGDHVIMLYNPQCGKCRFCKNPKTNLCEQLPCLFGNWMPDGTSRFTSKGQKVSHFMGVSSFSEYTVVPEWGLCKISNKIPLNRACLLGCSVPSGYGSAIKTAKVEKGSTCAIWGLGGVGLACALGCKHSGASRIIGIDVNPEKFEIARKFGITECLNPKDYDKPVQEILKEKTGGDGFDYTFECVGAIETMKAALESTINGYGTTVIIGGAPPGHILNITPVHFLLGHTCKGNIFGDMEAKKDLPKLVDMYLEKKLPLDDLVSHEYPFEKINALLEVAFKAECIRCLINY